MNFRRFGVKEPLGHSESVLVQNRGASVVARVSGGKVALRTTYSVLSVRWVSCSAAKNGLSDGKGGHFRG